MPILGFDFFQITEKSKISIPFKIMLDLELTLSCIV